MDRIKALTKFAEKTLDCSVAQLALAWCIKNPNVSTVLLGATKPEQLEEKNAKSLEVVDALTVEHMTKIDEIVGHRPAAYQGFGGAGMRQLITI